MAAGLCPILFKGSMSVFVNRNDTDEHRFLSYSIIRVICGNKLTPHTHIIIYISSTQEFWKIATLLVNILSLRMLFFPLLNAKLYKIFYWDKYFLIKVQKLTVVRFTLRGVKTAYNKWLCSAKRLEYCLTGLGKLNSSILLRRAYIYYN